MPSLVLVQPPNPPCGKVACSDALSRTPAHRSPSPPTPATASQSVSSCVQERKKKINIEKKYKKTPQIKSAYIFLLPPHQRPCHVKMKPFPQREQSRVSGRAWSTAAFFRAGGRLLRDAAGYRGFQGIFQARSFAKRDALRGGWLPRRGSKDANA